MNRMNGPACAPCGTVSPAENIPAENAAVIGNARNADETDNTAGYPIAMAYVPRQQFENLYCPLTGLQRGTVFEALNLPFTGLTVSGIEQGGNCRG